MVRFLALYTTPSDSEAFERHYREVHVPLAKQLPGLRRYTISRNVTPVRGDQEYYLVAELEYDDMDTLRAAFVSPQGKATADDVINLTALTTTASMIYEVEEL
jgi:uncharacterized protein (TIGR02118 family)